ncbi:MAG: ATP-binding cassette domain-containing protein [Saprospiraceae bacterium]|nr:ATP-binding cassette domain-containing protein [Saprospiraceae bacterium]
MLETKQLAFSYDSVRKLQFPDINCARGDQWLILGQSGSGKTTLLHLLGGLLSPQSGSIKINDKDISILRGAALDHFRGQNIGIIFQTAHFVRALTVEENLLLAQQLAGNKPDKILIHNFLEKLNLKDKAHKRTDELSVGEAQRVNVVRALINKPSVILADEPTSALDDHNAEEVIQLLESQAKAVNATLLIVTHDGRLKNYFQKQLVIG